MRAPLTTHRILVAAGALALWATAVLPVAARDFVQDQAGMFSAGTVAQLNERIGNFNAQTAKEIVVLTVPSLGGATLQNAAGAAFAQQSVNGVLIFIARDDRRDIIVPDRAGTQAGWFTPDVLRSIRAPMETAFRSEDYDGGITSAVAGVLNVYRAHLTSLQQPASNGAVVPMAQRAPANGGVHISMFWWIIIIVVGFLIVRSILRAVSTPRYYGGGPGAPPAGAPPAGAPPGGPGYGAGYGPGYGYGGGGNFWSGLLGGLGGAWLGNELFRGGGGGMIAPTQAGQIGPDAGGGWGGEAGGGWQSDAGQADVGGASGGDWGGGGFGGDIGGSGGDFGGGGDAGGGW
jgi:uncharacterized membrane protein YgcG